MTASKDISTTYIGVSPVSKYNDSTGVSSVVGFQYTNVRLEPCTRHMRCRTLYSDAATASAAFTFMGSEKLVL